MHHYRVEDAVAEAYAMVFLVESGFAQQTDVARAFSRSVRTIRRYQERYAAGGMAALSREEGWRCGRRLYRSRFHRTSRRPARAVAVARRAVRIGGDRYRIGGCEFRPFCNPLYYVRQSDFPMSSAHACHQATSDGQYDRKSSDDADSRSTLRARVHRIYLSAPVDAQAGAEM